MFRLLAAALPRLMGVRAGRHRRCVVIEKEAGSVEELLVAFLNELLYLNESQGLISIGARGCVECGKDGWRGRFAVQCCRRLSQEREVKAATHHGLAFSRTAGGVSCEVIFDL